MIYYITHKKRKMQKVILSLFLAIVFSVSYVTAVGTHMNVTISEIVYRNTTFAEYFDLSENTSYCIINGTLNITNPGQETVYDIYLQFSNTGSMITNFTWVPTTKFGNHTSGGPGQIMLIHIPSLRQGNYSTYTYAVSCLNASPPLDIDSNYTNADHNHNRKVLAGYNWTVEQTITNLNYLQTNISNINITITAQDVLWNSTLFNFSLQELNAVGDYLNVYGNGTSNYQWWWTPNGGELEFNNSENISYQVRAPYSVPFTATYRALLESITYDVNFLISNVSLDYINGSADINFSLEKRIAQPADNTLSHNVTWEIRPSINTKENITFDINKVTMWVTENLDPTNDTGDTAWGGLNITHTGSPMKEINISTQWGNSSYYWFFNYTDGANSTYPPPIVWMQPEWLITNAYGQIMNYTTTRSGTDYYIKYIYVIHGYWLEVAKNVTSIGEDQYRINIFVENIGNGWTPEFTYVTVYDFVPNDFAVWNMSNGGCPSTQCQNLSVGSVGSDFYGMSYRWNIPWKGTMNASLGPKVGPDATSWDNYSWNVSYTVNGTGPYKVTDLYIVGLDPLKVDGASVSPVIAVITGLQSYTKEIIYLGIVAFLIVINVSNLIITNKINSKLDDPRLKDKH